MLIDNYGKQCNCNCNQPDTSGKSQPSGNQPDTYSKTQTGGNQPSNVGQPQYQPQPQSQPQPNPQPQGNQPSDLDKPQAKSKRVSLQQNNANVICTDDPLWTCFNNEPPHPTYTCKYEHPDIAAEFCPEGYYCIPAAKCCRQP